MSWHDPSQQPATEGALPARPMWGSIGRGLRSRCPACGEALHHHRADDAPAYFVILIVGHVVVPAALMAEVAYAPPYWLHAVLWLPLTIGLAVGLLQPIKGAIVGWQWANYMHGFDPNAETEAGAEAGPVSR